jgi:hypothetical protein
MLFAHMRRIGLVLLLLLPATGCARYYQVTDPRTQAVYYTRDVDKRDSGAAEFADARTGARVTLQSSVIERITKERFQEVAPKK